MEERSQNSFEVPPPVLSSGLLVTAVNPGNLSEYPVFLCSVFGIFVSLFTVLHLDLHESECLFMFKNSNAFVIHSA